MFKFVVRRLLLLVPVLLGLSILVFVWIRALPGGPVCLFHALVFAHGDVFHLRAEDPLACTVHLRDVLGVPGLAMQGELQLG